MRFSNTYAALSLQYFETLWFCIQYNYVLLVRDLQYMLEVFRQIMGQM